MLEKVKIALRVKSDAFNLEIDGLIAACLADLRLAGVIIPDDTGDSLIERAVILYCKGNYGFIEENERFLKAYDLLKCALCLAGDYNAVE